MLTRIILKPNLLRRNSLSVCNITPLRQFSNKTEENTTNNKGLSFLKMDINSMKSKVIYGIGGVSLFYLFTKGFYVITYDLLASSPAGLLLLLLLLIT